jgi:hypothetical protein
MSYIVNRDKSVIKREDIESYIFPAGLNAKNYDSLLEKLSEFTPNIINFNNNEQIKKISGVIAYKINNEIENITYYELENKKYIDEKKVNLLEVSLYKGDNKNFYKILCNINCKSLNDDKIEDFVYTFYQNYWSLESLNIIDIHNEIMTEIDEIFYEEELFWGNDIVLFADEIERVSEPSEYLKVLIK